MKSPMWRVFRCNFLYNYHGMGAVLRQIPSKILTVEQLGLPNTLLDLCNTKSGLVLVTGPTGSGKSTTLAAMVNYINETMSKHIITLEKPDRVRSQKQTLHHCPPGSRNSQSFFPECPSRSHAFGPGHRSHRRNARSRHHPARDSPAPSMGMLVFSTLHTNSAPQNRGPHHRRLSRQRTDADPNPPCGMSPRRCFPSFCAGKKAADAWRAWKSFSGRMRFPTPSAKARSPTSAPSSKPTRARGMCFHGHQSHGASRQRHHHLGRSLHEGQRQKGISGTA